MKTSLLVVLLLLLLPVCAVRAGRTKDRNVTVTQSSSAAQWPANSVVSVYFVQNMFTANEKLILWKAIETWTLRAKQSVPEISFVSAGETGGLIDCKGCLTIAKQGFVSYRIRQRVSFHALRLDGAGRLVSAWIEFERDGERQIDLKTLMIQALDRGFDSASLQTAKVGRH